MLSGAGEECAVMLSILSITEDAPVRGNGDRNLIIAGAVVHQAFADVVLPLGGEKDTLTVRLGRQEFEYGSGRLIDVRDGVNLRLSFDAARLLVRTGDGQVDGWWSKPVLNETGAFDDEDNPTRSFWGVYAVHPLPLLPQGNVDLYYLGFENKDAVYVQGTGYELRHSLGTRLWGKPLPWEYNVEYLWQFGTFGPGNIEAWSAANAIRYNLSDLPLKPRLGLRFDVASGDNNPTSPNLQTFNPLFPSGIYFNLLNPVGPLNLIDLHPTLDLYAGEKVTLSFDWDFFWRESLGDGVYRISGTPLRPGVGGSRYVGNSPAVTVVWDPTRHVTLLASYIHFFPGAFFKDKPPDKGTDYFTLWLDYKF
jgi:Alginate export